MATNVQKLDKICPRFGDIELGTWLEAFRSWGSAVQGAYADKTVIKPVLAIGTTSPNVANGAFEFQVGGVGYAKAAVAAGTALSGDSVPQSTFGAWRLQIGTNGTVDIAAAAANTTGYASAALAKAGIAAVAANHAPMGWVTAYNTAGAFTPGTTNLDAGGVAATYEDDTTALEAVKAAIASAALPASLAS